jgi:small GTP-binding protein
MEEDDKMDNEDQTIKCKVVLLGKSGVGKTSIISRYTTNVFKESLMTTPGANFITKKVNFPKANKTIKFEIWDTAGQERYRSLAKVFYNNASACILVYDITNKDTFNDIVNYWIPELKENAPKDTILALAGNKSDLYLEEQVNDNEGKNLAKSINAIYLRTSAKLNSSIDELFNNIGNKYLNPEMEIISNLTKEEMIQKSEQSRRDKIRIKNDINNNNRGKKKCC